LLKIKNIVIKLTFVKEIKMSTFKLLKVLIIIIVSLCFLFTTGITTSCKETIIPKEEAMRGFMKIESPSFGNNKMIPSNYTCDGANINPPLIISDAPKDAKSLVLIVDDPDAPSKTWVHWTIWNINPNIKEIPENTIPEGAVEGVTDFGKPGYGGPCPNSGIHHYFFKLYALDITLNLNSSANAGDIQEAMQGHILDSSELIGIYKRK
jgi:Raf kinase inhibitor-like YbhB/YbcL family protein